VTPTDPPPITAAPPPHRRPRLVALDLDGTCIDAQLRLHPRIRDAVRATVAAGTPVVIASGRMYRSALPWAQQLRVRSPLICYQGAVVRELPGAGDPEVDGIPLGRLLSEDGVEATAAAAAVRRARAGGWHRQAYVGERLLCEEDRAEAHLYAGIARVPIVFVEDLEREVAQGSTKLVCVVTDPADADRCESEMRAALGAAARVTRSLPPFVEVVSPHAGKGSALRRLCRRYRVDPADALAVGDAPNDSDMLELCGFAVAVRTAPAAVTRHADALCGTPEEGGVADVLETLGLA
jgi:hydroxymethylpyrimidine pyrophosphatase-like HAD family hydrolase